jgi:hypothetical protein
MARQTSLCSLLWDFLPPLKFGSDGEAEPLSFLQNQSWFQLSSPAWAPTPENGPAPGPVPYPGKTEPKRKIRRGLELQREKDRETDMQWTLTWFLGLHTPSKTWGERWSRLEDPRDPASSLGSLLHSHSGQRSLRGEAGCTWAQVKWE